jgi:hypothetical protein
MFTSFVVVMQPGYRKSRGFDVPSSGKILTVTIPFTSEEMLVSHLQAQLGDFSLVSHKSTPLCKLIFNFIRTVDIVSNVGNTLLVSLHFLSFFKKILVINEHVTF